MDEDNHLPWWLFLVAGMILVLAFIGCPRDGPDAELARTAREAVELARDAQADDRSAVLWAGRFRLLALIIGVCAPILVAAYIWRSSANGEIDPVEVIEQVEQYALDRPPVPPDHSLPASDRPGMADEANPPDTPAD